MTLSIPPLAATVRNERAFAFMILNGSMEDDVIAPYLDNLVEAGYGGVCLHPRDGLLVPYASRYFWERMERVVALARERGLEVWFYDEFAYPSGAAGGAIPELHPEARVRCLQFEELEPQQETSGLVLLGSGPLLAVLRYTPGEGGALLNLRDVTAETGPHCDTWVWGEWHNRYYTGALNVREERHERASAERFSWAWLPSEPLGGDRLLTIRLQTPAGKKGWAGMPDITLPEVTGLFLERIYRPYAEMAKRAGLSDVPVFQDEVSAYTSLPWNREIEKRLRPLWGENIFLKMAALHSPAVAGWEQTRHEYRRACAQCLEENWFARVANWCHDNGLTMTGHLPGEESLMGHCQLMGNAFASLRHFDIPGYDLISSPTADDVNRCQAAGAKLAQSAAWWAGGKPCMAEVFGAHGFHHDLQTARTETAWLAVHDIDTLVDHGAFVSALSLRKYDAPPIWNRFNPLAAGHGELWQWHRWFTGLLHEYAFAPQTLVLFPVESLARYSLAETERWRGEVSLLETFFHYLITWSFDCLFLPSDLLSEVQKTNTGFSVRGHDFRRLIVPPVQSLQEETWDLLAALKTAPGLMWMHADEAPHITVFGPNGSRREAIQAAFTRHCNEASLLERRAAWFEDVPGLGCPAFTCDDTIIQSRRVSRGGSVLLIVINPNEHAVTVHAESWPGRVREQPGCGVAPPVEHEAEGWSLRLLPRDIAIFDAGAPAAPHGEAYDVQAAGPAVIAPYKGQLLVRGDNHFSLSEGRQTLAGFEVVPFSPQPVSASWQLPVAYMGNPEERDCPYAPWFSMAELPEPLPYTSEFPLNFTQALPGLFVVLDQESLPPDARLHWDGFPLAAQERDIYEQNNTVYSIPTELLSAGAHTLRITATVTRASHGVLERPILCGRFQVKQNSPLTLAAAHEGWQDFRRWDELGLPQAFGPVDYRFRYRLSETEASGDWALHIPSCIGVAEVEVNGLSCGKSCWEPRVVPIPREALHPGDNLVLIHYHGSWNNLFSNLNRRENGLPEAPLLIPARR